LKYSFQFKPNTCADRIYGSAYQGIGLGYYDFGNKEELGNPIAIYLYQGARIARITSRLSLNYEWNFGLSLGWKPYDEYTNPHNSVIGSKANAYINAGIQFNWMVSREIDLVAGITGTHFSNGNTKFPNAGLNTMGLKVGVIYNFNRPKDALTKPLYQAPIPKFSRYLSYDLTLFGSWRRKGVWVGEGQIASPDAYTVLGFNFAPMYNIGYKFRTGVSLDGVYDASSNVYTIPGNGNECYKPSLEKQLALGISGRAEYVMPYFTVGVGIGANVLHGGGDHKGIYQVLTLKVEMTRSSYLHIGYNLKNFSDPASASITSILPFTEDKTHHVQRASPHPQHISCTFLLNLTQKIASFTSKGGMLCYKRWHLLQRKMASFAPKVSEIYRKGFIVLRQRTY